MLPVAVTGSPVVVVGPPVTVHQGHTAILPCWLNPPQNAEDLEVQWYRSDRFDSPIVLSSKKFDASKEASYIGRVSFGLKDASSGGLTGGDVSLKLVNVTIEDAGDYTCYVSSEQGYDRENVKLHVIGECHESGYNTQNYQMVLCESQGWYPEPKLRWSDQKQDLTPKVLKYNNVSSGLVSVRSWLLVPTSSEVSCSVGLPDGEAKESRMHSGFSAGWVAFAILLIAALSSLGLLFYKRRGKYIFIKTTLVQNFLMDSMLSCLTATKGTPGFSSGQHYWEVSLGNSDLKQSWWVGVTNVTGFPRECSVPPTTSNGFWFLSSSPDRADSFQFSTEPNVLLPVHSRPKTVGVYLNYDSGELTFYNVEDKCVIGSLTAKFTGEVFPLFNPGKNDKAPMEILQRESSIEVKVDGENVNSTAHDIVLLCHCNVLPNHPTFLNMSY
uniref:Ig-like domain-containing protein n=1 Tax=Lates calcarifer TaxID=8187 RepID=A0A4W6FCX2_LATCA